MGKDQELLDAARNGNLSVVEKIMSQRSKRSGPLASLRRGPGANVQDNSGYTPLHHAALNGHKDVVSMLLAHDASTNIVDNKGSSPLHLAAWTGNTDIVKMILTQGVMPTNVNLTNHDRETPLHSAAQYGHTDVVSLLLQHNADPTIRSLRDETPLDLAAQYGRLEAVELLVRTHPQLLLSGTAAVRTHSPLHLASRNGHRNVVLVLLRAGLDVNTLTDMGTALHEAALFGKVDVVRVLLDHGVDLEAEDCRHRTVMDILDDLKMHISQEIAAIIKNHSTLISTSDDLENANHSSRSTYGGRTSGGSGRDDSLRTTPSPHYYSQPPPPQQHHHHRSLSGSSPGEVIVREGYPPIMPKPRHLLDSSTSDLHHRGNVDAYQVAPQAPRSLESSLEDSDLSMASSLYQTPPPPRDVLDDSMSISSYYDTPSSTATSMSAASRDGQQRTSLPIDGDSSMLYQVPPAPQSLKRMSDPSDSKTRSSSQGWYNKEDSRIETSSGYSSSAATSYIPMAPVQGYNRGSLKPPQKPPRKNMSPHSPTKFQQQGSSSTAYEFLCLASSVGGRSGGEGSDYESSGSEYRYHQGGSGNNNSSNNEYVEMKMRHSYAPANYENTYPLYQPNDTSSATWDSRRGYSYDSSDIVSSMVTGSKTSGHSPTSTRTSLGSPYENVVQSRERGGGSPTLYSNGDASYGGAGGRNMCVSLDRPTKPNSLNLHRRTTAATTAPIAMVNHYHNMGHVPLSPTGYDQPPTPDFPPPSPSTAEHGILEKIRPLSQASDGKDSKCVSTENIDELFDDERPFAGLYRGSTTHLTPTPTSSDSTCGGEDHTPTMASAATSDSEANTSNTLTNENSRRRHHHHHHQHHNANNNHHNSSSNNHHHHNRRLHSSRNTADDYEDVQIGGKGGIDWTQGTVTVIHTAQTVMQPAKQQKQQHVPSSASPASYENVPLRPNSGNSSRKESLSILSPFDENEEWAKIADIMASFGGSIATESALARELEEEFSSRASNKHGNSNSNACSNNSYANNYSRNSSGGTGTTPSATPTSPLDVTAGSRRRCDEYGSSGSGGGISLLSQSYLNLSAVGLWLVRIEVPEYENLFLANGFDDLEFMGGDMLEDQELFEIGVMNAEHRSRIITAAKELPAVESLKRPPTSTNGGELTVEEWLEDLHLQQYEETFFKHRYCDMDRVLKMWEVELTTVLEITRLGHKKRILMSLGDRPPLPHPYENINELNTDLKHLTSEINQLGQGMVTTTTAASSGTLTSSGGGQTELGPHGTLRGTKVSRKGPAPQPPKAPSAVDSNGNTKSIEKGKDEGAAANYETILIREPSQLFSGIPTSLTTQWRHKSEALISDNCNYTAQYLGSTLVRELKGIETTKKSIQKLKKSTSDIVKVPNIVLSISFKGVKFIDAKTKNVVCEHEIRNIHCACQDADDLNHFAYITKDHQSENHYCHVFSVINMDLATEVILTLGQAFEVAYQMALKDRAKQLQQQQLQQHNQHSSSSAAAVSSSGGGGGSGSKGINNLENCVIGDHNRKRYSSAAASSGGGGGSHHQFSADTRQSVAS